ncbi:hypothetical protein JOE23_001322 [Amphibacillus cookii]|nr:hypothetical protein [Amphibacillus cookii]
MVKDSFEFKLSIVKAYLNGEGGVMHLKRNYKSELFKIALNKKRMHRYALTKGTGGNDTSLSFLLFYHNLLLLLKINL